MKKELSAGTKDEKRTTADFSTSASVEATPMLCVRAVEVAKELYHKYYDTSHHWNNVKVRSEIAAKCVILTCQTMEKELQGHSDLHGYWQDENERQSIVKRIQHWQSVKKEAERLCKLSK